MAHKAGVLDAVQQHIGDAKHVRKLLLLERAQRALHFFALLGRFDVVGLHVANGAGQKATGAAGGIKQSLAGARVDAVGHESGDRAGRIVFARIAGRLQVVQQLFIEFAEVATLVEIIEIDLIDLVDHLPQQLAGFHVIVGVLKDVPHDATPVALLRRKR